MSRCTGHCCRRFYLPLSPVQIQGSAELVRLGGRSRFNPIEITKVADMVILVDSETRDYTVYPDGQKPYHYDDVAYFYTCKYHNKDTGDCMNYENRPDLCKGYPYGGICGFKGYTYRSEPEVKLINKEQLTCKLKEDRI